LSSRTGRQRFHHLLVAQQHRAAGQRDPLRAEQALGRAQPEGVVAAVQHAAQDGVREVVEEERRDLGGRVEDQRQVGVLERRLVEQPVAKGREHSPVLARVRVGDGHEVDRRQRPPRRLEQHRVQRPLARAGVRLRRQLRPRQVGAQEVVRDEVPPARVALQEVPARAAPEVRHRP
jgi:hypothetical protein